jgi:putative alpha-1,2-mannosidase
MASWAAFYLLGMYPVPSTTEYLLASPWFPEVSFYIPALNKTTTIKANGFEGNPASGTGGKVFVSVS